LNLFHDLDEELKVRIAGRLGSQRCSEHIFSLFSIGISMFSFLFFALLARLAIAFVYLYILCASHLHGKSTALEFFDSHFSKEGPSVLYIAPSLVL